MFDSKGNPSVDIDMTDHRMPKYHIPQHKHYWHDGVRDEEFYELDDLDKIKNKDVMENEDD